MGGIHRKVCIEKIKRSEDLDIKILICLVLAWHISNNSITVLVAYTFNGINSAALIIAKAIQSKFCLI